MPLDEAAARAAIESEVATPLGLTVDVAAYAILELATEKMVHAIEDVTVIHGSTRRARSWLLAAARLDLTV